MKILKDVYKDYFKIGCAVSYDILGKRSELIARHFNTITCENEMKFSDLRAKDLSYTFEKADAIYGFAQSHGIEIRGHNFVWHQAIYPELLESLSPEELIKMISEHINTVGERYKNVSCWDVINEAVSDDWNEYLRDTVWKRKLGDDYCIRIYSLVRELLPYARLVYNDYNEYEEHKRADIIRLVTELKDRGLIDAVGLQSHIAMDSDLCNMDNFKRSFEDYAKLGLPLQITELDIGVPDMNDPTPLSEVSADKRERQAKLYGDYFALLREYSDIIESVTTWGVSDDQSWLNWFKHKRECSALLFDKNGEPTDAFYAITEF